MTTAVRLLPSLSRTLGAAFALLCLPLLGSRGEAAQATIRIGLQSGQQEVRLRGEAPVRVEAGGVVLLTAPAGATLTLRAANGGLEIAADEAPPLPATGAVLVAPEPPPADEEAPLAVAPRPLIRLLGPGRHYDGKADRPYRGVLEILPRETGLTVVNVVDMEEYLWGVVPSEMSPRYPAEALKAQAIAARTYALKNRGRRAAQGFDLDDTAACQVYGGVFSEDPRTTQAVNETAGKVLVHGGKPIDAVYSSTCGGYTESAEAAWGRAVPYLVSVADFHGEIAGISPRPRSEEAWASYCKTTRALNCLQPEYARPEAFRWVKLMTRQEIEAALPEEYAVGTVREIVPVQRGESGRITTLRLVGSERTVLIHKELPIRRAFGGLRSSAFTVDAYADERGTAVVFAFWGAGWGHGLGMCQVGAVGLAARGWTHEQILAQYYRGAVIEPR